LLINRVFIELLSIVLSNLYNKKIHPYARIFFLQLTLNHFAIINALSITNERKFHRTIKFTWNPLKDFSKWLPDFPQVYFIFFFFTWDLSNLTSHWPFLSREIFSVLFHIYIIILSTESYKLDNNTNKKFPLFQDKTAPFARMISSSKKMPHHNGR